jgi:hypothetical protein
MVKVTGTLKRGVGKNSRVLGVTSSRRSYSSHSKTVNNAFLIVFDQYEKAFEELAKV